MRKHPLTNFCVCPQCRRDLAERDGALWCETCAKLYRVEGGVPILLPDYEDEERRLAYLANYEQIARDDQRQPLVPGVFDLMHKTLIDFIGQTRGSAVLDVGSAYGSYLDVLDADLRVAVDLALPALQRIPDNSAIVAVCGDAEFLPVKPERFDIVIIADILEHLLNPEALVDVLANTLSPDSRVIVHIPWRESLEPYRDLPYHFSHLRSFTEYSFRKLFWRFDVTQERSTLPLLSEPILFRLKGILPRRLYNELVSIYFTTPLSEIEYRWRERWIRELPRREGWLLRLFEPQVKMFELRKRVRTPYRISFLIKNWARRAPAVATEVADGRRAGQEVCP